MGAVSSEAIGPALEAKQRAFCNRLGATTVFLNQGM